FSRLHDWQVTGLLAFEDATGIGARLAIRVRQAGSVAHQAACRDVFAPTVAGWNGMARSKRHKAVSLTVEERVRCHHKPSRAQLCRSCKRCVQVVLRAGLENMKLNP